MHQSPSCLCQLLFSLFLLVRSRPYTLDVTLNQLAPPDKALSRGVDCIEWAVDFCVRGSGGRGACQQRRKVAIGPAGALPTAARPGNVEGLRAAELEYRMLVRNICYATYGRPRRQREQMGQVHEMAVASRAQPTNRSHGAETEQPPPPPPHGLGLNRAGQFLFGQLHGFRRYAKTRQSGRMMPAAGDFAEPKWAARTKPQQSAAAT